MNIQCSKLLKFLPQFRTLDYVSLPFDKNGNETTFNIN